MPLVSVIMSVYNGERYLREALESILDQSFTDFEFLIVNDGSIDSTAAILHQYAARDARVIVFSQENKGLNIALNRLIAESKGKFLARMDADDISEPERFDQQVKYMERRPDCSCVVGGSLVINENGDVTKGKYLIDNDATLRTILYTGVMNPFTHGSIMFRRAHLQELGLIYRFRYSQDFDLLMRLAAQHKIGSVEKILYRYREGSSLQKDSALHLKRMEQKKVLLDIYKRGRLFDDDYCISTINKIYEVSFNAGGQVGNSSSLEVGRSRLRLKSIFLHGSRQELRSAIREYISTYGFENIYIAYFILSLLPHALAYFIIDVAITTRNCFSDRSMRYLTISELLRY